jgi:GT2 family glycosyltransferase
MKSMQTELKKPLPIVSVVIVNWNAKAYLQECLASLREDVYDGQLETIVVDNASSDGSVEMVREQFPEVTVICNDSNLGFAKANNIGIRQCKGEYIALVNSDVHVLKDCITNLVAYSEANPSVGLVGPKIIGRDGNLQYSCRGFPAIWNTLCRALALDSITIGGSLFSGYLLRHSDDAIAPVDILSGCFWLARRRALDDVGLLDEAFFIYGEDMDWCKRFWDAQWPVMFVPTAQAIHYGGGSSANAPVRFFIEMQRADLQYWAKHHSKPAVSLYSAISYLHHSVRIFGYSIVGLFDRANKRASRHKLECSAACLKWMTSGRHRTPEMS